MSESVGKAVIKSQQIIDSGTHPRLREQPPNVRKTITKREEITKFSVERKSIKEAAHHLLEPPKTPPNNRQVRKQGTKQSPSLRSERPSLKEKGHQLREANQKNLVSVTHP
ncbi:uncharacterized protein PGTG_10684 [Puccinia graminis f. sp. tritici CRL 75-36-700-3]|uniref:Uncharacterized protein n=1 Tax=Puccinia graminis f. sp. tritici (strain CRL 75-36-700-3 / race SCCL) TaxID=418459 RepID=E3KJQ0_PUCGT|nr:uncharacterized protein PGTG_10684 [Puccinia graminis f. sp. tritici CRL 75-36-700-3]EFP84525.1 hypothetical protein PGTG_10684 [Puccinia graminis f. sp. tritici CRL 75-36-700-3]